MQPANEASNFANVDTPLAVLLIPPPLKWKKKLSVKAITAAAEAVDEAVAEAVITATAALKPTKKVLRVKDKKPKIK